ncbi:hypothetical protein EDD29_5893 [Actinocorallia herbida]|uniref:Mce-associated membrane protein n=1 Tax=Actinocorallia herbida TaxID=58109 RepID=A0A3N1D405_9ACTN|nr:hypothetical protein [Actinocorallia herbida]ROO88230.1 hypothetical protein EDD29_5893 [Actinocorallia herbida]
MSHTAQQTETDAEEAVASTAPEAGPEEAEASAVEVEPSDAAEEAVPDDVDAAEAKEAAPEKSETADEPSAADKAVKTDEPETADGPVKAEEDTEGKAPRKRRIPRISLDGRATAIVVLLALTVSIVTAAFLWRAYAGASDELAEQQQVRTRSAEAVTAFLRYDVDDLETWDKTLTALAVPDYRSTISNALKVQFPVITQLQATSEVTVRDVFVNDFDGPVAKAVVVADSRIVSKEFIRSVTGMRLLVELERQGDGSWLMNGLGVLGIDEEGFTDAQGNPIDAPADVEVPAVPGTDTNEDGS